MLTTFLSSVLPNFLYFHIYVPGWVTGTIFVIIILLVLSFFF